jgi:small GTP-binding protein
MAEENIVNIAVVGDTYVGKTNLIYSYAKDEFVEKYVSTVSQEYEMAGISYQNQQVRLTVIDNSALQEHESLREFAFSKADGVIICFSLADWQRGNKDSISL